MNTSTLAFLFVAIGASLFLIVACMLFVMRRSRRQPQGQVSLAAEQQDSEHGEAVLLVEPGGRIRSINRRARQIFHLLEEERPNLERIARRARPSEAVIGLSANEGQARFVVDGRLVEGTSYRILADQLAVMVVTLRQPDIAAGLSGGQGGVNAQSLQLFTQVAQSMAANLDLDKTLLAVLDNITKLIPADRMEITVWDAEAQLFTPYRPVDQPGIVRRIEPAEDRYSAGDGMVGRLYRERKPVLVSDVGAEPDLRQAVEERFSRAQSYLGFPLMAGTELVGTLELGSMSARAFREEDVDLVRLLSGQAAAAVHNALLYESEQRRMEELSGLAQLSQAFGSARDPDTLFTRLISSIAPLIPVDILGFLLYNETTHMLEARAPFRGLPEPIVALYHTKVIPGSPAEKILLEQMVIISENASADEKWFELGMDDIAQAASLRETALLPLSVGGNILGYLQASNHSSGSVPFSQAELHLLMIIANQSGSIIENASLVHQSRQRALRAEALRRVTSLASSAATLDEILQYAIQELGRLLHADAGYIFLLDQEHTAIRLHKRSVFGSVLELPSAMTEVVVDDPQYPFSVAGSSRFLVLNKVSQTEKPLIPFYQSLFAHWQIESAVGVPLVVRDEGIGELWYASKKPESFDQGDVQVVATAAGQLAGVVEQAFLRSQTDDSLRRRVEQMTAISRISRELSTSLDLNHLLNMVYDEALRITRADCGTILLFDLEKATSAGPSVRFFVGDMPDRNLSALERSVLESGNPTHVPDFDKSPYAPPHTGINSALITPIAYQQRRAGLICLHGKSIGQFDETTVEISQSLALQAAVALNNAQAFEEQNRRGTVLKHELDTLSRLVQVSRTMRPGQTLQQSLAAIAQAIQSTTPFQMVLISVYDPETRMLKRTAAAGIPADLWEQLAEQEQSWNGLQQLLLPEFRIGDGYYIPENQSPVIPPDVHIVHRPALFSQPVKDEWRAGDLMFVPLYDASQNLLGLISVDAPEDCRRPERSAIDAVEVFAAQAGAAIESQARVECLERQVRDLEEERIRMDESIRQAQVNLPVMLHKDLEQSISLRGMNQRFERVRASLWIAATANQQESEETVLRSMANELLTRFAMQSALIAEKTPVGIRLLDTVGSFPAGANPDALFGQRNPLRSLLLSPADTDEQVLLVSNMEDAPEWQRNTLLKALGARSMVGFRLSLSIDRSIGLLVVGQRVLPAFLEDDRRVFAQLANQVTIGLRNLHLLTETRRRLHEVDLVLGFSRKLNSMNPGDILTVLLDSVGQVVQKVHTGWVGMWDEKEAALIPQAAVGYSSAADMLEIWQRPDAVVVSEQQPMNALAVQALSSGRSARIAEVNFSTLYHLSANDLMHYRKATGGRLPVSAMIVPLLVGEKVLGVMLLENFDTPGAFNEEDEALASSFTRQAVLALENARLYQATERRAAQMQALTNVSGAIASNLRRDDLISSLLHQLGFIMPYETATLWLRSGQTLRVAAATGFADHEQRLNLSVDVEDSALFKEMSLTRAPISVGDLRSDPRFPRLIEPEFLSWLGIPLFYQSELIGVVALEKREVDFYTADMIQAGMTFAGQAAVALENARLYEESTRRAVELAERSTRLAQLNRLSSELVSSLDMEYILRLTGGQLLNALHAAGAIAVMADVRRKYTLYTEVPVREGMRPLTLPYCALFDRLYETQGIYQSGNTAEDHDLRPIWESVLQARGAGSLLVVPLVSGAALQGWFLVYGSEECRYSLPEIELARTMCNQSAIAVQNARLFGETRRLTADLERRVEERTRELRKEHKNSQTLLQIIAELSTSLDMGQVLNRTLGVLNDSLGCEESIILLSLKNGVQYRSGLSLAHLTEAPAAGMLVERQIARWVVRSRQPVIVQQANEDGRWEIPAGTRLDYSSVMAVPLIMGEEVLGTLILLHRQPGFFAAEQTSLLEATARQISIALNNAELFNLIRDQSEHLGIMLREQQIEASRSRAILEAVGDGVLVTDTKDLVTLFNASAERILGVPSTDALGKPLDHFSGLFGREARDWMRKIRDWSHSPGQGQNFDPYTEQITLDNGRIAAVNMAPVFWRQEFLGTVSIFRDITHEVQVDRLKSEFVANVSHELRTPMTSIKGYVEIMLMGAAGEMTPQQTHFLQIVRSNTERLTVLVNDLLDISRIEAGRVSLNLQPLAMNEIAEEVIGEIQRRSQEDGRPMVFQLSVEPGLPFAFGDTERMRQVVTSLVSNAYNYTPPGGSVHIKIHQADEAIQVDVQDNGIGIDPSVQHRIFERFYRGEDPLVLATAGTGLGLAIARALIDMHHGKIWFESSGEAGEGSVFSFTLPVSKNGK